MHPSNAAPANTTPHSRAQSVRLYVHWGYYVRTVSSPFNNDVMHIDDVRMVVIRWAPPRPLPQLFGAAFGTPRFIHCFVARVLAVLSRVGCQRPPLEGVLASCSTLADSCPLD
jgi:hypothetical protein